MKTLLLAGAALALAAGATLSPAMAQATPSSRGDASQAMYHSVAAGAPDDAMTSPHYAYAYHYGGSPRHPRWELERVLVR
jgi:hypothetical protein